MDVVKPIRTNDLVNGKMGWRALQDSHKPYKVLIYSNLQKAACALSHIHAQVVPSKNAQRERR